MTQNKIAPAEATRPQSERDERMAMFLEILSASGGEADASEGQWNWINAFCADHEGLEPDTFNRAHDLGYTTVTHDSDTDHSVVYLTDFGRAAITALDRHRAGDDALREENARLRGALRDASVSLWWAARQMKGNCNGGAVDAVNLAAENASSVAALTGRQG